MAKTATIHARIDPELKREVEVVLEDLGLSISESITLFYKQILWQRGLPFEVHLPNALTRTTFEKTDRGEELVSAENAEDLFQKLIL